MAQQSAKSEEIRQAVNEVCRGIAGTEPEHSFETVASTAPGSSAVRGASRIPTSEESQEPLRRNAQIPPPADSVLRQRRL